MDEDRIEEVGWDLLNVAGVPTNTLRKESRRLFHRRHQFLDWDLADWRHLYENEIERCILMPGRTGQRRLPQVLLLDNTNGAWPYDRIVIDFLKEPFELSAEVLDWTDEAFRKYRKQIGRKKRLSNNMNLALRGLHVEGDNLNLRIQTTTYFDVIRTHHALDFKPSAGGKSLRERVHGGHRLEELEVSKLPNQLGVNTLLFTAGGKMLFQERSHQVVVRPGQYASAASGTLDLAGVAPGSKTANAVALQQEVFSELGLAHSHFAEEPKFLGITRELVRGGKPEMFFSATTSLSEEQVIDHWKHAEERWEIERLRAFDFPVDSRAVLDGLDRFVELYGDRMSLPLATNLALWIRSQVA